MMDIFRDEPGCSELGRGGLKTFLKIDLSKPEGVEGNCGVKYNGVFRRLSCTSIF